MIKIYNCSRVDYPLGLAGVDPFLIWPSTRFQVVWKPIKHSECDCNKIITHPKRELKSETSPFGVLSTKLTLGYRLFSAAEPGAENRAVNKVPIPSIVSHGRVLR